MINTANPFVVASHLIKTSDNMAQASIDRSNLLNIGLAAIGAGAGARGLRGIMSLAKRRLNPVQPRYPAAITTTLPYPVDDDEQTKRADAHPLWYYPGMIAATGLGAYGGWKGIDSLLENRRQKEQEEELGGAKQDFEHALLDSYSRPKTAEERTVGHEIGELLDRLFDGMNKQAVPDWLQNTAGGYLGYALATGGIAGAMAYNSTQKNSNRAILEKAMKRRQQRAYMSRPSEILAIPKPMSVRGDQPAPAEEESEPSPINHEEAASPPLRRRLDMNL